MSDSRHQRALYTKLVWVFIAIAAIGVTVLIYESIVGQSNTVMYSLIVFIISIAALVMTTLQSLSISRQMELTESMMRKTNQSNQSMRRLVEEDRRLERDIRKDMQLDQMIVGILEQHGVGKNADVRRQVAKHIAEKTKSNRL